MFTLSKHSPKHFTSLEYGPLYEVYLIYMTFRELALLPSPKGPGFDPKRRHLFLI
jgi:hypothetical protein